MELDGPRLAAETRPSGVDDAETLGGSDIDRKEGIRVCVDGGGAEGNGEGNGDSASSSAELSPGVTGGSKLGVIVIGEVDEAVAKTGRSPSMSASLTVAVLSRRKVWNWSSN